LVFDGLYDDVCIAAYATVLEPSYEHDAFLGGVPDARVGVAQLF
jgi:hypothetical protein